MYVWGEEEGECGRERRRGSVEGRGRGRGGVWKGEEEEEEELEFSSVYTENFKLYCGGRGGEGDMCACVLYVYVCVWVCGGVLSELASFHEYCNHNNMLALQTMLAVRLGVYVHRRMSSRGGYNAPLKY